MPTEKELWPELEKIGEETVRARLATHVYGDAGNKRALIEEWLRQKNQERKDASASAQISVARDAANAARDAAVSARDNLREAKTANRIAKAAIVIATIAIIVSIVAIISK